MLYAFFVGYGDVVPLSDTGKIVTMFYAIPGIALNFSTYSYIARALIGLNEMAVIFIEIKLFKRRFIKDINIKVLIVQICMTIGMLCSQAALSHMKETENYGYLDSVYFVYSTLTTIGFGDFHYKFEKYVYKPHLFILSATLNASGLGLIASIVANISTMLTTTSIKPTTRKMSRRLTQVTDINQEDLASVPDMLTTTSIQQTSQNMSRRRTQVRDIYHEHLAPVTD